MKNLINEIKVKKTELNNLYKELDKFAKKDFNNKFKDKNYKFDYSSITKNGVVIHFINEDNKHESYILKEGI